MPHLTLADIVHLAPQFAIAYALCQAAENAERLYVERTDIERPVPCQSSDKFSQNNVIRSMLNIPLSKVSDDTQIYYVSAIALKLSASWNTSAPDIANSLLRSICFHEEWLNKSYGQQDTLRLKTEWLLATLSSCFELERLPSSWLRVRISNTGLALWLAYALKQAHPTLGETCTVQPQPANLVPDDLRSLPELFSVQHAIARCYSLLHSAPLAETDTLTYAALIQGTSTLGENLRVPADLRLMLAHGLVHASLTEHEFLHALVDCFDQVFTLQRSQAASPKKYLHLASTLSQDFQQFYAHHRFNATEWERDSEQVQFRLSLVQLCVGLLRSLLENGVGVTACRYF